MDMLIIILYIIEKFFKELAILEVKFYHKFFMIYQLFFVLEFLCFFFYIIKYIKIIIRTSISL